MVDPCSIWHRPMSMAGGTPSLLTALLALPSLQSHLTFNTFHLSSYTNLLLSHTTLLSCLNPTSRLCYYSFILFPLVLSSQSFLLLSRYIFPALNLSLFRLVSILPCAS